MSQHIILSCFLFIFSLGLYAQSDSTQYHKGFTLGLEATATFEQFPGFAIDLGYFLTEKDLFTSTIKLIADEQPRTTGLNLSLKYNRFIFEQNLFLIAGINYHNSSLTEDVIVNRLDSSFFQELDLDQKKTSIGGIFGFGIYIRPNNDLAIRIDMQFVTGREIYAKKDNVPIASEIEIDQIIDDRFIFNSELDIVKNKSFGDLNITLLINL